MKVPPCNAATKLPRLKIRLTSIAVLAPRRWRELLIFGAATLALSAARLHAQTLYFDGSGASSTTQTGTWANATTPTDWNTANDGSGTTTYWTNGDAAVFSLTNTTAATVTMGSAVSASSLTFSTGATTINAPSGDTITVVAGGITIANGASGSVGNASGAAAIVTSVSQTWTNNGSATFVDGGGSIGGGTTLSGGLILSAGSFTLGNTGQNNNVGGTGSITVDSGATMIAGGATAALQSHALYLNGGTIGSVLSKCVSGISAFLEANSSSSVSGNTAYGIATLSLDGNYTLTANSGSYTVINVIQNGTSGNTLTIAGAGGGTVALNGTSTFSNATVTVGAASGLSFGAGGTGGDINTGNSAGAGFTGGTINDSGTVIFNHSNAYSFNGFITGTGAVTGAGGTDTLTNASSNYTGVTTVTGGILSATSLGNGGSPSSIGAATNAAGNIALETNGTFQYSGSGGSTDRMFTLFSNNGTGMSLDASGTGAIDFTNTGSISVLGGKAFTFTLTGSSAASNTLTPKITNFNGSNALSLSKTGAGTWILAGANTYTGPTSISAGVLSAGATNALATTSGITVTAAAGTLSLTANSALATPTTSKTVGAGVAGTVTTGTPVTVSLGGGTLLRNGTGVSAGTGTTVGVGALTLTAASTLDFGTTGVGTLNFNGFLDSTNVTLTVTDYTRTTADTLPGTDGTDDRLIFNEDLTTAQLADISFNGTAAQEFALSNGEFEVTPLATTPEPATWAGGFAALGILAFNVRRRAARSAPLRQVAA